ncbi:MAG: hypothetical protein Q7O66_21700 [Dehalococcoidia bacterium]|nr:hypothetical protein [Dehalococcoidia bacterium]
MKRRVRSPAENGADDAFDDIISAFLYEHPLPEVRRYARYLLLPILPQPVQETLERTIVDEYRLDEVFIHAYRVGYSHVYGDFDGFLQKMADLVITGVINGVDDMLTLIYRAFLNGGPLPPARRNARRVKNWFVPPGSTKRDEPARQSL